MRLTSFTLQRYGNYEAERICFDPAPGVVNILLAPNSAGKSVLRNAFADLLFGIHNQSPMGFRYGYPGMRLSADVLRADGSSLSFGRRKARGNMISDADGQPLDAALLHGILGGRDRALLERLFVLDTEALRDGGKALLATGGDVASALLSAAGGLRQVRALKQRLERQRDELAPERRTASRPFYLALDRFNNARRGGRSDTLLPEEWFRQERELEALRDKQRAANATAETASAEIARLQRIRSVRPALARHAEASAWLAAHPDAPALSTDLVRTLSASRQDVVIREDAANGMRVALENARLGFEEIVVDTDLLSRAEQIELLTGEAGAARKARGDVPGVSGQYEHGLTRIRDLLRQLGSPLPPEQANDALPRIALVARTRKLIDAHAELAASVRNSDEQIEARRRELVDVERQLGELPAAQDWRTLEGLLETIRADGVPAARRADAERSLSDAETALNDTIARVPGWSGPVSALAAMAPLTTDIYVRHEKDVATARAAADTARQLSGDATDRLEQARTALAAMVQRGAVPDQAALALARTRRDSLWRLIYRRAFTDEDVEPADEAGVPLPLAFERAITEADTVADRRYAESDLLARIAATARTVSEAEIQAEAAEQRSRLADERLAQTQRIWTQICSALPLGDAPTLADIQAFVGARERVIDAVRRRDVAGEQLAALTRRHAEWARALADSLDQTLLDLPVLLGLADRILSRSRELRDERLQLEAAKRQFEDQIRTAAANRAAREEKLTAWRVRWQAAMTELARPDDEDPAVTAAVLETLRDIAAEHRETSSLAERIGGMRTEIAHFTEAVRDLVQSLPSRGLPADPFEAAREAGRMLHDERALEQRRRINQDALEKARTNAAAAEQALHSARVTLRATLDLIGAETIDAAEQRLALSAERARVETQFREAAAELFAIGDGFPIDALRTEAEQVPPDEVPARINAATAARKEAGDEAQRIAEEASALGQRMERAAEAANVNIASTEQNAASATLSRTLDEALVYHTAALLLGRALEAIEKSGDSRLLQRLGSIFAALTGGIYSRVVTEPNDDGATRLGLIQRDFPDERQSIDQLSEGTRDQFFLALRVAAIEDHITGAEPLPFIGDDILQTFDDDRALAALRVLAELSRHTQVIVLTHHRHVLELASRLPAGAAFTCRREPLTATV